MEYTNFPNYTFFETHFPLPDLFVHDVFDEGGHVPQDDALRPDGLNEVFRLKIKAWASVDQVGHHLRHGPLLVSVKDVLVRLEIAVQQLQCSNIDIVFMLSSQTNAQTVSFNIRKHGRFGDV